MWERDKSVKNRWESKREREREEKINRVKRGRESER